MRRPQFCQQVIKLMPFPEGSLRWGEYWAGANENSYSLKSFRLNGL